MIGSRNIDGPNKIDISPAVGEIVKAIASILLPLVTKTGIHMWTLAGDCMPSGPSSRDRIYLCELSSRNLYDA